MHHGLQWHAKVDIIIIGIVGSCFPHVSREHESLLNANYPCSDVHENDLFLHLPRFYFSQIKHISKITILNM